MSAKPRFHSLATKFAIFAGLLVIWVTVILVSYHMRSESFSALESVGVGAGVLAVAVVVSVITSRLLIRPLATLNRAMESVSEGRFDPVPVSHTCDEIEILSRTYNQMTAELARSHREIREHRALLELRIRERTEELEFAMHRAQSANHAKSEFLANVSHELRTPMNGILGMLELALDRPMTVEQRDSLETAQTCAHSLLMLLNDILDLSRIEAGKMQLEAVPVDLRAVAEESLAAVLPKAREKGLQVRTWFSPDLPASLIGDPLRIRQIALNLLSNAVKFTETGSVELHLDGTPLGSGKWRVEIEVQDTGVGIPADKIAHIFNKFTQADGSITRRFGGTGLGLAITKRLTEVFDGAVSVTSTPGEGSVFRASIEMGCVRDGTPPAGCPAGAGAGTAPPREPLRPREGGHILIVEDNLINQKVVCAMLGKQGYTVSIAQNGLEAVDFVRNSACDLILMDVQMPVMDGLEATRKIRELDAGARIPILAMTAHAMKGDRERCLECGMNDYLSKPIQSVRLLDSVRQLLQDEQISGPPRPRPQKPPIDRARADELNGGDKNLTQDMLHLFLQVGPERIENLEYALASGDPEYLRAEAGRMRAAAERIAAEGVAEPARALESCADRDLSGAAAGQLRLLQEELQRLKEYLSGGNPPAE